MENEKENYQKEINASIDFAKEEIEEAKRLCFTQVELNRLKYTDSEIQKATILALEDEGYRVDEESFLCRWNER